MVKKTLLWIFVLVLLSSFVFSGDDTVNETYDFFDNGDTQWNGSGIPKHPPAGGAALSTQDWVTGAGSGADYGTTGVGLGNFSMYAAAGAERSGRYTLDKNHTDVIVQGMMYDDGNSGKVYFAIENNTHSLGWLGMDGQLNYSYNDALQQNTHTVRWVGWVNFTFDYDGSIIKYIINGTNYYNKSYTGGIEKLYIYGDGTAAAFYFDEIFVLNRTAGAPPTSTTTGTVNLHSPANNTINDTQTIRFNYNATNNNDTCFLYTNSTGGWTANGTDYTPIENATNNFSLTFPNDGNYFWNVGCNTTANSSITFAIENFTLTLDIINPVIETNFTNNSIYYKNNITAQINFTDDNLFSINISIDNTITIFNITNITGTSYIYNLSYDISSLSGGFHNLTLYVADGHTSNLIPDYKVKDGIFNNYLDYTTKNNRIRITPKDVSIFDKMSTTKLKDRYTFDYIPNDNTKDEYSFIVESQSKIYIINNENTKYKTWLISGNNWVDFYMREHQNIIPTIKLLDDYTAEITLKGFSKTNIDKLSFNSVGDLNIVTEIYGFHIPEFSYYTTQSNNVTGTGDTTIFGLYINTTDMVYNHSEISAFINLSGSQQTPSKFISGNITYFTYSHYWNNSYGNSSGIVYPYNWTFNITNISVDAPTSLTITTNTSNITIISIAIDDCSSYNNTILNFTMLDETTQNLIDKPTNPNVSIEIDLTLKVGNLIWHYNDTKAFNNLSVCIPVGFTNTSNKYYLTTTVKYSTHDHTTEYHYFDGLDITSLGTQNINLYTLNTDITLSEYSTSFILNYLNRYYIPEPGAIVDLLRYYVGNATYLSVEHGKLDSNGDTVLHFVAENIRYKIIVRKNNEIVFTSYDFSALCQTTPCQISFTDDSGVNALGDYTKHDNLIYTILLDKTANTVTATFATDDGTASGFNLLMKPYTAYTNDYFCSESVVVSGGTLQCVVPDTYQNRTFLLDFKKDNETVTQGPIILNETNAFGLNGVFFTVLLYLTLIFMAIPSGAIAVIIFAVLGVIIATLLTFITVGSIIGKGAIVLYIIIAATIILIKAAKRNG